ncbi:MAG: prolyl-tRNA synthetase, partial [Polaromonas sp.]|nr:prolyl-tRNA synthetase [Polaromonas sp.]
TIGDRGLKEGHIEYQHRRDTAATQVGAADAFNFLKEKLAL